MERKQQNRQNLCQHVQSPELGPGYSSERRSSPKACHCVLNEELEVPIVKIHPIKGSFIPAGRGEIQAKKDVETRCRQLSAVKNYSPSRYVQGPVKCSGRPPQLQEDLLRILSALSTAEPPQHRSSTETAVRQCTAGQYERVAVAAADT